VINKTELEKDALLGKTEDAEGKQLDEGTKEHLEHEIHALYRNAKTKGNVVDSSVTQKINNSTSLSLVEDTENILNKYLEEFEFIEHHFPALFKETATLIKKEKRKANMEINLIKEKERIQAIAEKRQQDKDNKKIVKVGKPLMKRIYAPPVKKLEVKKRQLTEEEEDTLNYLGI
jgi:hypothetical protein